MPESLNQLLDQMAEHGATRFYAKVLAPNDNSKNQVYLGGGFGALNVIPHGAVEADDSSFAGSVRDRAKAAVRFFWIDPQGLSPVPDAKLILYPGYPEVRMSGFLRGVERAPRGLMRSRDEGRVFILGICQDGRVIGYVAARDDPVATNYAAVSSGLPGLGVFTDLEKFRQDGADPRQTLLDALSRVHSKFWIPSQKLNKAGVPVAYRAGNGGGYTLEAELGISPNGYAEPDFMGWEVKQYGVRDFDRFVAKNPVTLMTPEPTGGVYREEGPEEFLHRFGYADRSGQAGRVNFGGIYTTDREFHAKTGLALRMTGFDALSGKITDVDGSVVLIDRHDTVAASWAFRSILAHWNRKHAKAVYVPSLKRDNPPEYRYGPVVRMCEGTDVLLLLGALARGTAYYDPGIKMEYADTGYPLIKRRSQFRVKHANLLNLYKHSVSEVLPVQDLPFGVPQADPQYRLF